MKFGVRQIANVVFRAANEGQKIGAVTYHKGQPVFYLDTAKTSSMEGSATSVYATGGRGNTRLLSWEGEKTLTFTVEDALLSPISFSMLAGANVLKGASNSTKIVHFHQTTAATSKSGIIDLSDALLAGETICSTAPIYVMATDDSGDLTGEFATGWTVGTTTSGTAAAGRYLTKDGDTSSTTYMVDYYVKKVDNTVTEIQIDAGTFGGYFYVEADTLFRRQSDGKDLPANLTFPLVKIQSNFTFSMSATGDPSTFNFTMDAFPGYTYFNTNKKVLCAIQVADDGVSASAAAGTVFPHPAEVKDSRIIESISDSVNGSESAISGVTETDDSASG